MQPPPLTFPLQPRTSAPQPSLFQVFLDESCYNYYLAVVKISFDCAYFGICRALPRGSVSKTRREAVPERRNDEDQQFLCKCAFLFPSLFCVFVCFYYMFCVTPPPINLPLPLSFQMCMDESFLIV